MALSLGPAESPVGVPARCARWDPNLPDAVGVSHEDGTFTYFHSGGRSVRLQLFTLRHSTTAASGERPGLVTPAAVHAPWSLWSFIRGCPGRLLLCLRHSPHVLTTQISLQQLPTIGAGQQAQFPHVIASSSVQEVAELEGDSALTALTVSSCGCFGATGSLDGTVCFWQIEVGSGPVPSPSHLRPCVHEAAHTAPVTAIAMLTGQVHDAGIQTALCASGAADQSVLIFDLHARTRLVSLLTPAAAPISALHLSLIPPYWPAAPADEPGEPTVLVLLGASDGGVQAWSLRPGRDAQLRAAWLHSQAAPVLAFSLSADGACALSVAEPGAGVGEGQDETSPWASPTAEPPMGEVEVHSTRDWSLVARRSVGRAASHGAAPIADPVVAADFSAGGEARLLLARASGLIHRWDVSEPAHMPGSSAAPEDHLRPLAQPHPSPSVSAPSCAACGARRLPSQSSVPAVAASPNATYLPHVLPQPDGPPPTAADAISLDANSSQCGGGASSTSASTSRPGDPRPRPPPLRPTPPPPAVVAYHSGPAVPAERAPSRARSPQPAPHRHYDNPERVRSLLAPPPVEGPPASRLAAPSALSSVLLRRQAEDADAEFAEHERAALSHEAHRRAVREATSALESPLEQATRYDNLPRIEADPSPQPRPVARRPEPRWLVAQGLQPDLLELFSADREPEAVNMRCPACAPSMLLRLDGTPADDEAEIDLGAAVGWPHGAWEKIRLGHQHPLVS